MNQFDDLGSMSLSRLFIFDLCLFKEWPIPVALFRVPTGARCTEPVLLGDLGTIQQDSSTGLAGGWGPGEVSSNGNRTVKSGEGNQMEVSIQSHVVPQARWMVHFMEHHIEMDENWGYPSDKLHVMFFVIFPRF